MSIAEQTTAPAPAELPAAVEWLTAEGYIWRHPDTLGEE